MGTTLFSQIYYNTAVSLKKKRCEYCKRLYPVNYFGVALTTSEKVYRRRKCRNCYRTTKQVLIRRYYKWLSEYKKQRGCSKCKVTDPRILDFHHKNDKNKLFTVGGFRRSVGFARIKKEVDKCDVVCANCHRIMHDKIRRNRYIRTGA